MDDGFQVACEMNEWAWSFLKDALADLSSDEVDWRPLPQGNNINVIVRHLRIEAQWHLNSLIGGAAMPSELTPVLQKEIDAVPLDFESNRKKLDELSAGFLETLRGTTPHVLQERSSAAYGAAIVQAPDSAHFLGYHQALHVAMHCGQIRTIRNLYRTTRGEPARFFPENPTYPPQNRS